MRVSFFVSRFLLAGAALAVASVASAADDTAFLAFPMATEISASRAGAFAWTVQQGDKTQLFAARGAGFKRTALHTQSDVDGTPITGIQISPDGAYVAFTTGFAAGGYNPASLQRGRRGAGEDRRGRFAGIHAGRIAARLSERRGPLGRGRWCR